MSSYTNIFGGDQIDPAPLSYVAYTFDANLSLVWPFEALDNTYIAANILDMTATVGSLLVSMPNATLSSTGQSNLFNNVGAESFTVVDYGGNTIINIQPGEQWFVYLTSNATANGTWRVVRYGAATSSADAAALAGFGLRANITKLDQNILEVELLDDYTFTANDRAQLFCNEGGGVVWTFTDAAVLTNGWFIYVVNCGSGAITLTPYGGQTIDNDPNKTINPGESCIVFCTGTGFNTVGYGRSLVNTVTAIAINAAGTGVLNLNATQAAAQVQDFSGTLTGNRTIDYGGGVGYWFVYNNTSGAFTMTFRVNNLDPGVTVSQGSFSILRSNGTSMAVAFTATTGTVTNIATAAGELTGGPITTTGTLGLANTAVTPGSYGAANETLTATVDGKGRLTALADTPIAITGSQVTDLTSIIAAAVLAAIPVGTVQVNHTNTLPTGWLYLSGQTIGNASSNATARANADTSALYTALWNSDSNLAIYTSAGALTTRGASAAADYAANKALALPDYRGRSIFGKDNMGGSAAGRLTVVTGTSLGAAGGDQYLQSHGHSITDPGHIHSINDPGHSHVYHEAFSAATSPQQGGGANVYINSNTSVSTTGILINANTTGISGTNANGSGNAQNIPPAIVANVMIKYA